MKVALVHNLRRGGAARRLSGTVHALTNYPGVTLREFSLSSGAHLLEGRAEPGTAKIVPAVREEWNSLAPRLRMAVRPPLRYLDHYTYLRAWARLANAVNDWEPHVVFANPCNELVGAPPGISQIVAPVLYYCDEPRRVDYENAAAESRRPTTRILYKGLYSLERRADRAGIAKSARIATNSPFTAERIRGAYGRRATVVPPGVHGVFERSKATGKPLSPTHLLSVGALIPSKGHDLAIMAAGRSGLPFPLVIVAPRAVPEEEARLRKIATSEQVSVDIRVGIIDTELRDLYQTAYATMYLAREEPLGLVSLESQACWAPVIASNEGGLAGTVDSAVTGYVIARTADEAAGALRRLGELGVRDAMVNELSSRVPPREDLAATTLLEIMRELSGQRHRVND